MRFSIVHKLASYLMVVAAYLALALSGEIPTVVIVLGAVGIVASWFWEPPRVRPERWTLIWNALAVGAFGYTILSAVSGGEWVISGSDFLVFLAVAKLFTRRSSRDYQWIYVITFLMLVAGTTLNAEISYALCFLGYVVFATWALILFHLRREMEDNFLLKHSDDSSSERVEVERILSSRRIVGGSFLAATSSVSLGIFVLSSFLFLLFPRVGFGLFLKRGKGHAITGFADAVKLGGHGLIRNDDTVVMRVRIDDVRFQGSAAPELHWRGVAFDQYKDREWKRSAGAFPTDASRDVVPGKARIVLAAARRAPGGLTLGTRQEIYLEPLDSPALFAASTPLAFDLDRVPMGIDPFRGQVNDQVAMMHGAGLHYVAWSDTRPPDPDRLRAAGDASPRRFAAYLQIPPEIPARVAELARRLTEGKTSSYDKAEAVLAYLRSEYSYTLEMDTDDTKEPLDHFLFERRKGHCEYFSSAMAILLRTVGIPTRNVDGFLGGEWNEYGRYIAVRSGDAHSWVEVWFEGVGWVTYDPTPPGEDALGRGGGGVTDRLRRMLDTLRLTWFNWVIEYDFGRQVGLVRSISDALGLGSESKTSGADVARWVKARRVPILAVLGCAAAALVALYVLRRRRPGDPRRVARRRGGPEHPVVQLYGRAAKTLARRGFPRPLAVTPREHAGRLIASGAPGATAFAALTELYYLARYAGEPSVDLEAARRLAAEVRSARPLPN